MNPVIGFEVGRDRWARRGSRSGSRHGFRYVGETLGAFRYIRSRLAIPGGLFVLLASSLRAGTDFPINVDPGSSVSIKISTPLTATPRFGFLPLRVWIENTSGRDEAWNLMFKSGRLDGFPGEIATKVRIEVPSKQNRETWIYVPVSEQGVLTNPSATALATSSATAASAAATAARAPIPANTPAAPAISRSFIDSLGFGASAAAAPSTLPPPTEVEKRAAEMAKQNFSSEHLRYMSGLITESAVKEAQIISMRAQAKLITDPAKRAAAEEEAESTASILAQANLTRAQGLFAAGIITSSELSAAQTRATAASLAAQKAQAAQRAIALGASSAPTALSAPIAQLRLTPATATTAKAAEEGARRVLNPTGLLERPAEIVQSVITAPLDPSNDRGPRLVVFVQTGNAAFLALPSPNSLPDGVVANVHPTDTPGKVTRTLTYAVPAQWAARPGISVGTTPPAAAFVRLELMRYGFGIDRPGVKVSESVNMAGSSASTTITETGPDSALPKPTARVLPGNIGVFVAPSGTPGEVTRIFFVGATLTRMTAVYTTSPSGLVTISGFTSGLAMTTSLSTSVAPALAIPLSPSVWTVGAAANQILLRMTGAGLRGTQEVDLSAQLENGILGNPPLATSPGLAAPLRSKVSTRSAASISSVDFGEIPADWRVWSSFHGLALLADEYEHIDSTQRAAIRTWVALGGQLFLFPNSSGKGSEEQLGAGTINLLEWPLGSYNYSDISFALKLGTIALSLPQRDALTFGRTSPLRLFAIDSARLNHRWTVGFLIGFAIIAGPVNFWLFAPRGKRHRLFISTPAIAIFGVIAVTLSIMLQDGSGGAGQRSTIVALLSQDNAVAVFQEQVARTGFLVSRKFHIDEAALFGGITLAGFGPAAPEYALVRNGGEIDGDWFRARWSQAEHVRAVLPSRARVDIVGHTPAGAPIVRSTITTTLRDFNYVDAADRIWEADEIPTGREVTLTASDAMLRPLVWTRGSRHLTNLLAAVSQRLPGRWMAKGGTYEEAPIATLPTITWSDDEVWYTGLADPGPKPVPAAGTETASVQ